VDLFFLDFL